MAIETWKIGSMRSAILFTVRDTLAGSAQGEFLRWSGRVHIEDGDLSRAKIDVTIDASSIDTGLYARDQLLKSERFLDAARYPEITFKSTGVEVLEDDRLHVRGDLTIRGVSHGVELEVENGGSRNRFTATTAINRKDFGLKLGRYMDIGIMVGNRVSVHLEVNAHRPALRSALNA